MSSYFNSNPDSHLSRSLSRPLSVCTERSRSGVEGEVEGEVEELYPLYLRTQGLQPLIYILITAVYLLYIINGAFAFGGKRCQ